MVPTLIFFAVYITILVFVAGAYFIAWRLLDRPIFSWLALGWMFNALYLVVEAVEKASGAVSASRESALILAFNLASTICFHLGVRSDSESKRRELKILLLASALCTLCAFIVTIAIGGNVSRPLYFLLFYSPAAVYGLWTLARVGESLGLNFPESEFGSPGRFLIGSWQYYAALQLFYPFRDFAALSSIIGLLFVFAAAMKIMGALSLLLCLGLAYRELMERASQITAMAELGNLTSGVLHDINTPLGTIGLELADLSRERSSDPVVARFLNATSKPFSTMRAALEVIRVVGLDPKSQPRDFGRVSARATINQSFRLLRPVHEDRVRLVRPEGDQDYSYHGNLDLLASALFNILKNAVEAGARRITIELARNRDKSRDKDDVVFLVRNDGRLMTQEELLNCMKAGWSSKDESVGSKTPHGLGLFMASRIVRIHKGLLRFRNDSERGEVVAEIRVPTARLRS